MSPKLSTRSMEDERIMEALEEDKKLHKVELFVSVLTKEKLTVSLSK